MLDPSPFPVMEFKIHGEPGSWMQTHIPAGILVRIPGWAIATGLITGILAAVVAMSLARTAKDFLDARREISQAEAAAVEIAKGEAALGEAVEAPAKGKDLPPDAKALYEAALLEWRTDFFAWKDLFHLENDRGPTKAEQGQYVLDNPVPLAEDYT